MRNQIDVKKLKAQLTLNDYETILKEIGIPIYYKGRNQWQCWTGDKNINAMSGSPKLYFYCDTRIFVSYTASRSYDIIGLVQQRLSILRQPCSFIDAIDKIMSVTGIAFNNITRINNTKYNYDWESNLSKYIRFKKNGTEMPIYNTKILNELESIYPQSWIDEGISIEAMMKYHIGYYPRTNATTIPCFDDLGNLIGIRVRHWNPEDIEAKRKYMPLILLDGTTFKFNTNNCFYGINYNKPNIEQSGEVILVESEKSVLMAESVYGDKSTVLGLYGSQLGSFRRNQLIQMGVKNVTLALDSDFHIADYSDEKYVDFEKKMLKFADRFKGYCTVDIVYNNLGLDGYQYSPFDFGPEIYKKLYEAKENII